VTTLAYPEMIGLAEGGFNPH